MNKLTKSCVQLSIVEIEQLVVDDDEWIESSVNFDNFREFKINSEDLFKFSHDKLFFLCLIITSNGYFVWIAFTVKNDNRSIIWYIDAHSLRIF